MKSLREKHSILSELKNKFINKSYFADCPETEVSSNEFIDSTIFLQEKKSLFKKNLIPVCFLKDIPRQENFIVTNILGKSIIIANTGEKIKAFYNRCRHRGAKIFMKDQVGKIKCFTCPFHNWKYSIDGSLISVPDKKEGFPSLQLSEQGLEGLQTFVLHGLVFISFKQIEKNDEAFKIMTQDFQFFNLPPFEQSYQSTQIAHLNWKLLVHGFLENYHFKALHPGTVTKNYLNSGIHADFLGKNVRSIVPKYNLLQFDENKNSHQNIRDFVTLTYFIFPFTLLFINQDHVTVVFMQPISVDKTQVRIFLMPLPGHTSEKKYWDANWDFFEKTIQEDIDAATSIQENIDSESPQMFKLGKIENCIDVFQKSLTR